MMIDVIRDPSYLRHVLELLMLVPASCFCLIPLRSFYRFPKWKVLLAAAAEVFLVIFGGAWFCALRKVSSATVLLFSLLLFVPSLTLSVRCRFPKLLFCTIHAVMMCVLTNLYTVFLVAPYETDTDLTFSPRSSLICLGLTLVLLLVFFRILWEYLPFLFTVERLDRLWLALSLIPFILILLFFWLTPRDYSLIIGSHIRTVFLVFLPLGVVAMILLYYLYWWIAHKLIGAAKLEQENSLLHMESKRYDEFRRYIDESRMRRHDYRQHLHVISALAQEGKLTELREYLDSFESTSLSPVRYCPNPAVDAVAAYYAQRAADSGTQISWTLELPESLPMTESDFCAMLGNLLDNSLSAVGKLPTDRRHIRVVARMLSDQMLGLCVENPYIGKIRMGNDGFPLSRGQGHGIGLRSVALTVEKYHGSLDLSTDQGIFSVSILLYPGRQAEPDPD